MCPKALHASPTLHSLRQGVEVQLQLADAQLQSLGLDQQQLDFKWINATEILTEIEALLGILEEKIGEVSDEVESAVESILQGIEAVALNLAQKWSDEVQKWVDKANAADVDIQICLQQKPSLADVVDGLRADAKKCVDDRITDLRAALQNLKDLGPMGDAILEEAKTQIDICLDNSNPIAAGVCLVSTLPAIKVKAAALAAEAVWRSTVVSVKISAAIPLGALCTSKVTAGRAAQATAIVNATVDCIRSKLSGL